MRRVTAIVIVLPVALLLVAAGCGKKSPGGASGAAGAPAHTAAPASAAAPPALVTQLPMAAGPIRPAAAPPAIDPANTAPAAPGADGLAELGDVIKGMEELVGSAVDLQKALLTSHPSGQAAAAEQQRLAEEKAAKEAQEKTDKPAEQKPPEPKEKDKDGG